MGKHKIIFSLKLQVFIIILCVVAMYRIRDKITVNHAHGVHTGHAPVASISIYNWKYIVKQSQSSLKPQDPKLLYLVYINVMWSIT